jgi:hypothetical protein
METKIDEVVIKGRKYVPADTVKIKEFNGTTKIVILQRGWVMVGKFERKGSDCKLHNASVIRSWGTTKGLGEIAANGPTSKTILDKTYGVVEFDYLTVVAALSVEESKWKASV